MATLQELLDQKAALDGQIAEARSSARAEAIVQIRKLMSSDGLTAVDLTSAPPSKRRSSDTGEPPRVTAKYRDPATGATWSGRGLKPRWLVEQLAAGKQIAEFTI